MTRYHPVLVALHWLIALLVLMALVAGGAVLEHMPNSDPEKVAALGPHMVIGIAILALMLVRLAVRLLTQTPLPADAGHPLLTQAGHWAHWALYALVLAMALSGVALSVQAGLPGIVFGGEGTLPESFDVYSARAVHGAVASLLMLLVAAHVAAALYHQFLRRDGLFRRMWFGARG